MSDLAERDAASAAEAAPAEAGASATVEEGEKEIVEAPAAMEDCVDGATGGEEAKGDEGLDWADDVEGLAMEIAG